LVQLDHKKAMNNSSTGRQVHVSGSGGALRLICFFIVVKVFNC